MRLIVPGLILVCAAVAVAGTSAVPLWAELSAKRATARAHLEFEVVRTQERATGATTSRGRAALDVSGRLWREVSDGRTAFFDGAMVVTFEDGGDEYTREKPKNGDPLPPMFRDGELQWSKLQEKQRRSCMLNGEDHPCVMVEVPVKPWIRGAPGRASRLLQGRAQFLVDLPTGLIVAARILETIQTASSERYNRSVSYSLKDFAAGEPELASFRIPEGLREVRHFSAWRASRIGKVLAGKPAPEFNAAGHRGEWITLAELKGKIVLLDFWATWCLPCRDDAPALDKLFQKYGDRDLAIIGVSVGEGREAVDRFFGGHPHAYANVIANENELPRPYHVEAIPTYIVIGRDGTVVAAAEGNQGFSELRRILKRAGLDVD